MNGSIQERVLDIRVEIIDPYFAAITDWLKRRWCVMLVLLVLQCICYTYFLTVPLLSNHTFPNVWLNDYPSYRTTSEGRWLADLVILFQGSSGVQSFQFACAVLLQAVNGLLLCDLLGIRKGVERFVLAGVLCLYPSFLDYYSFACDHMTFVLGDTLCLVGSLVWLRVPNGILRIVIPSILYGFSIAAYGPKIALVLLLAGVAVLIRIQEYRIGPNTSSVLKDLISSAATVFFSVAGYWMTLKLTVIFDAGPRTHINSLAEMLPEIKSAYNSVSTYYASGVGGFPPKIVWFPSGVIAAGSACLVLRAANNGFACLAITLAILALIPLMLWAPWIINDQSPVNVARIAAANGYAFVVFLGSMIRYIRPEWTGKLSAFVTLYFFIILATQQNNAAGIKSIYEGNIINRILGRCDEVNRTQEGAETPAVFVGNYPPFEVLKYVKYPPQHLIHQISSSAFAPYRQIETLNFLTGKNTFRKPTMEEVKAARGACLNRKPWPHSESVFMSGNILVVLLQPCIPGIQTTWDQSRTN